MEEQNKAPETKEPAKEQTPEKKQMIAKGEIKKRSEFQKFIDGLVTEDLPRVKRFLKEEVIEPYVKKALWDAISGAAEMFIFHGEASRRDGPPASRYGGNYTSYSARYGSQSQQASTRPSESNRFDYDTIVIPNRRDACEILDRLLEDVEQYGQVTVGAYYDYAGISTGNKYTLFNYGWTDLRTAEVVRAIGSDGWTIHLPRAMSLR